MGFFFYVLAPFLCILVATGCIVHGLLFMFYFFNQRGQVENRDGLRYFFLPFTFSFQKYVGLTFILLHLLDLNTGWDLYVNSDLVGLSITFQ